MTRKELKKVKQIIFVAIVGCAVLVSLCGTLLYELRTAEKESLRLRTEIEQLKTREQEAEQQRADIESRIITYLNAKNSIGSADIAAACVEAGADPFLLAAIATIESNANPWSPKGAAGEQGAWQVRAKYWGHVPADVFGQAAQAERVIRTLIGQHGSLRKALIRYNGQGPAARRYAERVLKIYEEIKG